MFSIILSITTLLIALAAFLSSGYRQIETRPPYIQGQNNTALFLANPLLGLSNVFIASSFALLENHPEVQVHYGSWPEVQSRIDRISSFANQVNPDTKDVIFHPIKGVRYSDACQAKGISLDDLMNDPGWTGMNRIASNMPLYISPWEPEDHYAMYKELENLIESIDPAVVIVDTLFRPAMDVVRDKNRQHIILTPNTHVDNFLAFQPYGAMFWKYPALGSGFSFPVPWAQIPENIYMNARFIFSVLFDSGLRAKQAALRNFGLKQPIDFMHIHRPDVPWITMQTEGANIPVDVVPANVTSAGPILVHSAPAEQQDPELVEWMKKDPTVLINLGTSFTYNRDRMVVFTSAIVDILAQSDVQIIWKLAPDGEISDDDLEPLKPYLGSRLRIAAWLSADPYALLASGLVTVSVHHGGSGGYHESISAGVPQVILPMWLDLYNFATLAESLNVGVWGCKEISPHWTAKCLTSSVLQVIGHEGMRASAEALGESIRARGNGRDIAAREIAKYAQVAN